MTKEYILDQRGSMVPEDLVDINYRVISGYLTTEEVNKVMDCRWYMYKDGDDELVLIPAEDLGDKLASSYFPIRLYPPLSKYETLLFIRKDARRYDNENEEFTYGKGESE